MGKNVTLKETNDVHEQPPRNDDGTLVLDLRVKCNPERDLHVRRRKVKLALGSAQHDPPEDLDALCAGRHPAAGELKFVRELVPTARDLHRRTNNGIDACHLKKPLRSHRECERRGRRGVSAWLLGITGGRFLWTRGTCRQDELAAR